MDDGVPVFVAFPDVLVDLFLRIGFVKIHLTWLKEMYRESLDRSSLHRFVALKVCSARNFGSICLGDLLEHRPASLPALPRCSPPRPAGPPASCPYSSPWRSAWPPCESPGGNRGHLVGLPVHGSLGTSDCTLADWPPSRSPAPIATGRLAVGHKEGLQDSPETEQCHPS